MPVHVSVRQKTVHLPDRDPEISGFGMFLEPALQHPGLFGVDPRILQNAFGQKPEFVMQFFLGHHRIFPLGVFRRRTAREGSRNGRADGRRRCAAQRGKSSTAPNLPRRRTRWRGRTKSAWRTAGRQSASSGRLPIFRVNFHRLVDGNVAERFDVRPASKRPRFAGAAVFVVVDAVDRPHGLVSVAEVEDSLDLLHKIDFEFLSSEPLARRLEAIAVDLHVVSFLLGVKW